MTVFVSEINVTKWHIHVYAHSRIKQ